MDAPQDYALDIRKAVKDCSERGLYGAARWAAEFLVERTASSSAPLAPPPANSTFLFAEQNPYDLAEWDLYALGKTYFDCKEFDRAGHVLKECKGTKTRFLGCYSRFLASEKRAQDTWATNRDTRKRTEKPTNTDLSSLLSEISNDTDPFVLFLKATILHSLNRKEESIEAALISLNSYPWNYSCWKLLSVAIEDQDVLDGLQPLLPPHPTTQIFTIGVMAELHVASESVLSDLESLIRMFPASPHLQGLRALLAYHMREFEKAEEIYDQITSCDPYRLEDVDIYSNILYVLRNVAKLSLLARNYSVIGKDRPEVCAVLGNYFGMRGEHEKAVKYFSRATQLDPNYLAAWTLMGHEYLEMKNSHAAIESYRRGVDINKKDYRAWFGLGQSYDLLSLHFYSLYYYQRAAALRPYDSRMWNALGGSYKTLEKYKEAIECFKRAQIGTEATDIAIYFNIAKLYEKLEDEAEACAYHRRVVEVSERAGKVLQEYSKSCLYVGNVELGKGKERGDWVLVRRLAEKVAGSNVEEVAQGEELLRKLNSAEGRKVDG